MSLTDKIRHIGNRFTKALLPIALALPLNSCTIVDNYRVIPSDNLFVHESKTDFPHVQLSQKQGEEKLKELALTEKREDCWIFYEENGKGNWLDCGYNQNATSVELNSRLIGDYFIDKNIESLAYYHIHTKDNMSKIAQKIAGTDLELDDRQKRVLAEYNLLPSIGDYETHFSLEEEILEQRKKLTSRLATPEAIIEYGFSDELKKLLKGKSQKEITEIITEKYHSAIEEYKKDRKKAFDRNGLYISEVK